MHAPLHLPPCTGAWEPSSLEPPKGQKEQEQQDQKSHHRSPQSQAPSHTLAQNKHSCTHALVCAPFFSVPADLLLLQLWQLPETALLLSLNIPNPAAVGLAAANP